MESKCLSQVQMLFVNSAQWVSCMTPHLVPLELLLSCPQGQSTVAGMTWTLTCTDEPKCVTRDHSVGRIRKLCFQRVGKDLKILRSEKRWEVGSLLTGL